MPDVRDWSRNRAMWIGVLERQTGEGLDVWKRRIARERIRDETSLRAWLIRRHVTGYAQSLLVMEQFGYPDFVTATARALVDRQYADRPGLRPIYDAIVSAATGMEGVALQTRKTYVALVTPRRTFARIQPTTRTRIDLGLRLDAPPQTTRLQASTIHPTMRFRVGLASVEQFDREARRLLRLAYDENS
jgi:Domain of unknown function (DUF5655)